MEMRQTKERYEHIIGYILMNESCIYCHERRL